MPPPQAVASSHSDCELYVPVASLTHGPLPLHFHLFIDGELFNLEKYFAPDSHVKVLNSYLPDPSFFLMYEIAVSLTQGGVELSSLSVSDKHFALGNIAILFYLKFLFIGSSIPS
jgi:hypothetical protein